jgi:tagatose 1,6-diphosphate aldolase
MPLTSSDALPSPPAELRFGAVGLAFVELVPGDESRGFAPFYHFHIVLEDGREAGHINFRVGDSDHVRFCAGHIGFEVLEAYRGRGYAFLACRAMEPFVRAIYSAVILTCDPTNAASRRTIERLGCTFIDEVNVPASDPHYARGSRSKLRYEWRPGGASPADAVDRAGG